MDIEQWTDQSLYIRDIGYSNEDTSFVDDPLLDLDIVVDPNMSEVATWLRRHQVNGNSTWHTRGEHRATRYLTTHNPVDKEMSDVDMGVLTYLTTNTPWIRVWSGNPYHSLASWIRIHRLTPTMWYSNQDKFTNWALGPDGILATIPPMRRISFLLLAITGAIKRHYYAQFTPWLPNRIQWNRFNATELETIKTMMGQATRVINIVSGLSFYEADVKITVLDSSQLYLTRISTTILIQNTAEWTSVTVAHRKRLTRSPQPSAFLISYHIIMRREGFTLLLTTDGRRELRAFISERLLPRLSNITLYLRFKLFFEGKLLFELNHKSPLGAPPPPAYPAPRLLAGRGTSQLGTSGRARPPPR
jgi:hypothetical protein